MRKSSTRFRPGKLDYKKLLREFWTDFIAAIGETTGLKISEVIDVLDEQLAPHLFPPKPDGSNPRLCPTCHTGTLGLRLGRFGAFLGCTNYPECNFTRPLAQGGEGEAAAAGGDRMLGVEDETGEEIWLKTGRFGVYVQRGKSAGTKENKPKRSSLPKGQSPADLTLERAIQLLSLPREVGLHPEDGKPITAALGRFGPYLSHDGVYANLESAEEVFTVGLNRAVTLIADKKAKGAGGGRFGAPAAIKELGAHPDDGAAVRVLKGRFGPYVNHGKVNANVPKDMAPEDMTLEIALPLLAAKAPAKKAGKAKKAPAAKAALAKKAAAPKTTAKAKAKAKPKPKPAAKAKSLQRRKARRIWRRSPSARFLSRTCPHPRPRDFRARRGWGFSGAARAVGPSLASSPVPPCPSRARRWRGARYRRQDSGPAEVRTGRYGRSYHQAPGGSVDQSSGPVLTRTWSVAHRPRRQEGEDLVRRRTRR